LLLRPPPITTLFPYTTLFRSHLHLNLDVPELERWMLDVMRDMTMHNEQVKARDGRFYKLRITPYRTLENKIDGVVVALLDITDLDRKSTRLNSSHVAISYAVF